MLTSTRSAGSCKHTCNVFFSFHFFMTVCGFRFLPRFCWRLRLIVSSPVLHFFGLDQLLRRSRSRWSRFFEVVFLQSMLRSIASAWNLHDIVDFSRASRPCHAEMTAPSPSPAVHINVVRDVVVASGVKRRLAVNIPPRHLRHQPRVYLDKYRPSLSACLSIYKFLRFGPSEGLILVGPAEPFRQLYNRASGRAFILFPSPLILA